MRRGGGESPRRRGDRESLRRGEREYLHGLAGKRDGVAVGVCAHAFEAQDVAHRLTQSPRARTARAGNTSSVGGHHARAFRSDSCASARPSAMSECKISVVFMGTHGRAHKRHMRTKTWLVRRAAGQARSACTPVVRTRHRWCGLEIPCGPFALSPPEHPCTRQTR